MQWKTYFRQPKSNDIAEFLGRQFVQKKQTPDIQNGAQLETCKWGILRHTKYWIEVSTTDMTIVWLIQFYVSDTDSGQQRGTHSSMSACQVIPSESLRRGESKFHQTDWPAPRIRTRWPSLTPALRHAWTPTDSGSKRAPSSSDTWSGSLQRNALGDAWMFTLHKGYLPRLKGSLSLGYTPQWYPGNLNPMYNKYRTSRIAWVPLGSTLGDNDSLQPYWGNFRGTLNLNIILHITYFTKSGCVNKGVIFNLLFFFFANQWNIWYIVYTGTKFPIYKVWWLREATQIRQTLIPLCENVV